MNDKNKVADILFKLAKNQGLVNPITDEGAPTKQMFVEALISEETMELAELSELVTYVRRLARVVRKHEANNPVATSAIKFLVDHQFVKIVNRENSNE